VLEAVVNRLNAMILEKGGFEDLIQEIIRFTESPVLTPRMPFGKHIGMLFSEVQR